MSGGMPARGRAVPPSFAAAAATPPSYSRGGRANISTPAEVPKPPLSSHSLHCLRRPNLLTAPCGLPYDVGCRICCSRILERRPATAAVNGQRQRAAVPVGTCGEGQSTQLAHRTLQTDCMACVALNYSERGCAAPACGLTAGWLECFVRIAALRRGGRRDCW